MSYDFSNCFSAYSPRHSVKKLGPSFIVGGDYNCRNTLWGSRLTNKNTHTTKDRELSSLFHEKSYSFLVNRYPKYWPTDQKKIPDLLEFFVTSGIFSSVEELGRF